MFLAKLTLCSIGVAMCLMLFLSASEVGAEDCIFAILASLFVLFLVFDIAERP